MVSLYTGGQAVIMLADCCPMHWIKLMLPFTRKETKMSLQVASYQAENYTQLQVTHTLFYKHRHLRACKRNVQQLKSVKFTNL